MKPPRRAPILCIGASNIDRKLRGLAALQLAGSNPARQSESPGGVARNVAENLARLGLPVQLLSAVGQDAAGLQLLAQLRALGVDCSACLVAEGATTGSYTAVLHADGELLVGLAAMAVCEQLTPKLLARVQMPAALTLLDLNLPRATIEALLAQPRSSGGRLMAVAVSAPKMARLPQDLRGLDLLLLNRSELAACTAAAQEDGAALAQLRARGLQRLVITAGADVLRYAEAGQPLQSLTPPPCAVLDVTGAGDAFAAGVCAALYRQPHDLGAACQLGLRLAALTLQCETSVSPQLSPALLEP